MARALTFDLGGTAFQAEPVKLDRKKVYGWTETAATDGAGKPCRTAWLDPDGSLVVPASGTASATLAADGTWLDAGALQYVDEAGNELPAVPSTFDAPVALGDEADEEAFLDHVWDSVYQLSVEEDVSEETLGDVAWFADNSDGATHPVGRKRPNASGLFDMHGNVAEWTSTEDEERGGGSRVYLGGAWNVSAWDCAIGDRVSLEPGGRADWLGLRLCADSADAAPAALALPGGVELALVPAGKGLLMGRFPVTQAQWEAVTGGNPAAFKGAENPVESVSWEDCRAFLEKLNALPAVRESGLVLRLPTEEEWISACRAGAKAGYCRYRHPAADLAAAVGERIFRFPFNYRAGPAPKEACLLASGGVAWLFAGDPVVREFVGLEQAGELEEEPEEESGEEEELDFGMM